MRQRLLGEGTGEWDALEKGKMRGWNLVQVSK